MPDFPLPKREVFLVSLEKIRVLDEEGTERVHGREHELWAWAWRTPQASAWALPSESWRLHSIAMWVRTYVLCESSEATAADKGSLHRFADQIGLTPAGLKENGWAIAADEIGAKRAEKPKAERSARRLRAAGS